MLRYSKSIYFLSRFSIVRNYVAIKLVVLLLVEILELKPGAVVKRKVRETSLGAVYESQGGKDPLPPLSGDFAEELLRIQSEDPAISADEIILDKCKGR